MATIKDIAKILVSRHKLKASDAELFLQSMVEVINEGLMEDRQVKIKGFGTFKLQAIKERASVNVNTGEKVVIGEHDKITFTPDTLIKEIVNKPFAQFDTVIINDETAILLENMPAEELTSADETAEIPTTEETAEIPASEDIVTPAEEETNINVPSMEAPEEVQDARDETAEVTQVETPEEESVAPIVSETPVTSPPSPATNEVETPTENTTVGEAVTPTAKITSITAKEPGEPVELIADSVRVVAETVEVVADKVKLQTTDDAKPIEVPNDVSESSDNTPSAVVPFEPTTNETENVNDDDEVADADDNDEYNPNINENENRMYSLFKYGVVAAVFFILGFFAGTVDWKDFFYENVSKKTAVVDDAVVRHEVDSALLVKDSIAHEEHASAEKSSNEQKAATETKASTETKPAETKEPEKKAETPKPATAQTSDAAKEQPMTQFNNDPRVKYGAYYIIGTEQTVTVKEGQTLKSISRSFFGPDMECYVEAYNGVKEVKVGQKIKIPKLKNKKIKK